MTQFYSRIIDDDIVVLVRSMKKRRKIRRFKNKGGNYSRVKHFEGNDSKCECHVVRSVGKTGM